jgi:ketosteroid isomerase-like protein
MHETEALEAVGLRESNTASANVDLVRRVWEAWERRDRDALFALYDPAIVYDPGDAGPMELRSLYHGHDGIRQFFRQWMEPFETFHSCAETFIDAGDKVVVGSRQSGRGKTSGAEVEMPFFWNVYSIRNGLVIRIEVFKTKTDALAAASVSQDAPTAAP